MLNELCAELKNYFLPDYNNLEQYIHWGVFKIEAGAIQDLPFLKDGQYFRILNSTFNDGVHKYRGTWQPGDPPAVLVDETFEGAIWEMRVPPEIVRLSQKIHQWTVDNAQTLSSPYQSESFGGYSYSLKTGASGGSGIGDGLNWQTHFAPELKPYRRFTVL